MKKFLGLFLTSCLLGSFGAAAQDNEINYDESKVEPYTLPELMRCKNGVEVTTVGQWEKVRRPEILEMFTEQMYGRIPEEKIDVAYETLSEDKVFNGKAVRRQVKFIFSKANHKHEAVLLFYLPAKASKKSPVPVFVGYNFNGNQTTSSDEAIIFSPSLELIKDANDDNIQRGAQASRWAIEMIIDNGFAVATMCYHDIYPDVAGYKNFSIMSLFSDYEATKNDANAWQAIGAWAWGSSRIADYLETVPEINSKQIAIMGHSRQGKAALWAGANDKRFAIVISNDSGEGGAALSQRNFGETVEVVSKIQPGWFCYNYHRYRNNEKELPFGQHELIALIAPRPVYVASAAEDLWADPKGEYLGAYYASPIYKLYGLKGLESDTQPAINNPVMNDIGYHIRDGKHDVTDFDWSAYIKFAKKHFK